MANTKKINLLEDALAAHEFDSSLTEPITLETVFNETGHNEDSKAGDIVENDSSLGLMFDEYLLVEDDEDFTQQDISKVLPLAVFKQSKVIYVPKPKLKTRNGRDLLDGKRSFTFPSSRLLFGFEQALKRTLDEACRVDVTAPDVVSVLIGAMMLKCRSIVEECIEAIDQDLMAVSDFSRAVKIMKKFPLCQSQLGESLLLYGLRHDRELAGYAFGKEPLFVVAQKSIRERYLHLFKPTEPKISSSDFENSNLVMKEEGNSGDNNAGPSRTPKIEFLSYPHLECFRLERLASPHDQNELVFRLLRERDGMFICAAKLNPAKNGFLFFNNINDLRTLRKYDQTYCGSLTSNLLGDSWTLYDIDLDATKPKHGTILYTPNALGRVPNAMKVLLPDSQSHLETKKPRWSEQLGWSLDFKRRVSIASKKNFLLLDLSSNLEEKIVMLFGKRKKHVFSLDLCAPVSPMLGFAIALTTFADKLIVT